VGVKKGNPELLKKVNDFIADYKKKQGFDKLGQQYLGEEKQVFKELGVDFIL
jgi:polar amino acid transport system substrate-binding protein